MNEASNHRLFCWQQVDAHQPLFRVSRIYAPPQFADRLLALYAYFASIEAVTATVSDEAVALRKLDWWREESNRMGRQQSAHPVVAELQRCGAAELMPESLTGELILGAVARIDAPAPGSTADLEALCESSGRAQVLLEMAVCGAGEVAQDSVAGFAPQAGAALLLREAVSRGNFWWVPLDLLARHGLGRAQLLDAADQDSALRLMNDVLGLDAFDTHEPAGLYEDISNKKQQYKHLFVQNALIRKTFKDLNGASPVSLGKRLGRVGIGDAFSAWRAARRFSLSK